MKKKMAFVSRHAPTVEQINLADKAGYELVHVGDVDAFNARAVTALVSGFAAVAAVHPAVFMPLMGGGYLEGNGPDLAVFENSNRAPEGEKPKFFARALHVWAQHYGTDAGGMCAASVTLA